MDSSVSIVDSDLFVVTENVCGKIYSIRCKYIQDLIDDWYGDCGMCPANDARVFFVSWNCKALNPYEFTDFESLMKNLLEFVQ